jgi:hypothetical protein
MSVLRRTATAGVSIGVLVAGTVAASPAGAASTAQAPGPGAIHVSISATHHVTMPTHLRPGGHKFMVRSAGNSGFQLLRATPGYTKAEAARDANRGLNHTHIAALVRFEAHVKLLGGVGSSAQHLGVMWVHLPAGTYWAVDTAPRMVQAQRILTVHVAGQRVQAGVKGTALVRAIHEHTWAGQKMIPHRGRLRFINSSADNHFIVLAKLAQGKTIRDFARWVRQVKHGHQGPPPLDLSAELDSGALSPGHSMALRYQLPPGHYVLTCFWPDAGMGGIPHAFLGMFRGVLLTK